MRVRVLGSAAGGGLPQWNCACDNCALARRGDPRVVPRTQDSLLVSRGERNLLVNASPDIGRQIEKTPALWPRSRRDTGISAIVLTNGDLDHVLGLFSLRESQRLVVYATESVWRGVMESSLSRTLTRFEGQVVHRRLALGERCAIDEVGLWVTPFAAPGKLPVHLMGTRAPSAEDNIGLRIDDVVIATAVSDVRAVRGALEGANVVFLDGTFFSLDELPGAESMAHPALGGADGSLDALRDLAAPRRVLTHINNTNPILREDSGERAWVESLGWEIARDGMEIDA